MEPSFKKARWVGILPEQVAEKRASEKSYWKRVKVRHEFLNF
jgi:hypothetical protein